MHIYMYTNYSVPGLKTNEENLVNLRYITVYHSTAQYYSLKTTFVRTASAALIPFVGANSKYNNLRLMYTEHLQPWSTS